MVNKITSIRDFDAEEIDKAIQKRPAQVLLDAADYIIERGGVNNAVTSKGLSRFAK
ncbi:hypothetical protein [Propionivibrio sp.]|uniref:hypothetical protein n=1 Tax=Propionivibrio sp. TaxID=2212460 RepID=UPI0025DD9C65|nr:hypothetical protein [Propionivibrio sp.]MBK8745548.1 hypothetical protein [Propionivibrio sp.]